MRNKQARRLALTYVTVAAVWLLFSDAALLVLGLPAERIAAYSLLKGLGFVAVTGAALYSLVGRYVREAEQREREYRLLFERNPNPMWLYDTETLRFLAVNDAAVARYGYSHDEFRAMTIADIRPAEDVGRLRENVAEVNEGLLGPVDRAGVWRHRTKHGEMLWVDITSHITEFEGRRAEFVLVQDVTDAHEARVALIQHHAALERTVKERTAELESANERLRAATDAKSAFLSTMSHELRTPLHSIIGFSSLMAEGMSGSLNEEQRSQITIIHDSAVRLLELINDVLDLSKIESGWEEVRLEPVIIAELVGSLERTMAPLAAGKGLAWSTEGPAGPTDTLLTDRRRIEQVLTNLLANAVKYTESGEVGLRVNRDAHTVRFSVYDTGPGIRPEARERIFQEFVRLEDGAASRVEGTGLGLTISARLARLLGGRIEVESEPGQGSTFTLVVPG